TIDDPVIRVDEMDCLIQQKIAEGYVELSASPLPTCSLPPLPEPIPSGPAPPVPLAVALPLREALEAALVENPDDLAAHAAYADFLQEQGDPRGEFIALQLALEDPGKSPEERQRLLERERELLQAHQREWLGDLAPALLDNEGEGSERSRMCTGLRF